MMPWIDSRAGDARRREPRSASRPRELLARRAGCRPRARAAPTGSPPAGPRVEQRPRAGAPSLLRERRDLSVARSAAASPARPPLEQLGPSGAERRAAERRSPSRRRWSMKSSSPRRPSAGPRTRAPAGRARRAPRRSAARRQRTRPAIAASSSRASRPAAAAARRTHSASARRQTLSHRVRRASRPPSASSSLSRIPACAFTISPSAQKVTPSPYGSERPWRQ